MVVTDIFNQYKKIKEFLILWLHYQAKFKLREPKKLKIYYFRINKQFRAYGILDKETLKIYKISNHQ